MRNKIKLIFAILSTFVLTTGCIKEKYNIAYDEANLARPIVEMPNSPTNKINTASVDGALTMVVLDLDELRIAPRSIFSGDITVTLSKDSVGARRFINAQPVPTIPLPPINILPANAWSIVKTNYTLNATTPNDRVKIAINTALIPAGRNAIGLSIQTATGAEISGLYKTVVVELKPKSPYEGTYLASGTRTNYVGPTVASGIAATFPISGTKFLQTVNAGTVDGFMGDLDFVPFYYSLQVASNNGVTVLQSLTNPMDTPPSVGNNGTCIYNPTTRTFTLNYFYLNGAGNLRQLTETLVRQ